MAHKTLWTLVIFSVYFLLTIYYSYTSTVDKSGCNHISMYPRYAKLSTFTNEQSRMASKYSLHLYREGYIDKDEIELKQVPVLFIPGHAGSFEQARSIAAYTAKRQYQQPELVKFDFYTVDFTEDFTAFHGQTMLDQAEFCNDAIKFILSLYQDQDQGDIKAPKSVLVIGHSMGGIVSRLLVALPNYNENSVNTILTLSTPHTVPPLTFDHDVMTVYDLVNQYWRSSFSKEKNELNNMVIVSLAGGKRDAMVPSDYCSTMSFVPRSHGFTRFTSGIPDCWTDIDHLAMTWCGQMREAVGEALFKVVDPTVETRILPVKERLEAFESELLDDWNFKLDNNDEFLFKLDQGVKELIKFEYADQGAWALKLDNDIVGFANITDVDMYKCVVVEKSNVDVDYSNTEKTTTYKCQRINPVKLPRSWGNESPSQAGHMYHWQILKTGPPFTHVLAVNNNPSAKGFFTASTSKNKLNYESVYGSDILDLNGGSMTDISIESATLSLNAYKIKILPIGKVEAENQLFLPLVRQYVEEPHESRFHVSQQENKWTNIAFHGTSPYTPFNKNKNLKNNLHLQVFTPPTKDTIGYQIVIKRDWFGTLSNIALRYRILGATMTMGVVVMVIMISLWKYNKNGNFCTFNEGLGELTNFSVLFPTCLALAVIHILLSIEAVQTFIRWFQIPSERTNVAVMKRFNSDLRQYDMFMGTSELGYCWLAPVFYLTAIGVVTIVNVILSTIGLILTKLCDTMRIPKPHVNKKFGKRRISIITVLLLIVALFVPFQFAFLVASLTQVIINNTRANRFQVSDTITHKYITNFRNFNQLVSNILIWASVVNTPILVVWIHNLVQHLPLRFSSHHNIFSVLPILLIVENISAGNLIPEMSRLQKIVTMSYLGYFAMYCFFYGVQHTYMLPHFTNVFCGWLYIVYLDDPNTRYRVGHVFHREKVV